MKDKEMKQRDWGFWEPIDQEEILEEMRNYPIILDEHTEKLIADAMKDKNEKDWGMNEMWTSG